MYKNFIYLILILLISNCVPIGLETEKRASNLRNKDCTLKKNNHYLLCDTLKLGVELCVVFLPQCYVDESSSSDSESSSE
jgi:hypothetical protein